jgi:ferredoxin
MPRITFEPLGKTIDCGSDETVFVAARRAGILLPTACVGRGSCGLCRVKVVSGEELLPPVSKAEKFHLGNTYFITKLRLACQLTATGDVTLQIPDAIGKKLPTLSGK